MNPVTAIDNMFEAAGFTLVRKTRHRVWRCPCGHIQLTSQSSPCKGRGDQNVKAKLNRALRECTPGGKAA